MKQDYWFEPGDKVMRVAYADDLGFHIDGIAPPETEFGVVLCVKACWHNEVTRSNDVSFIGVEAEFPFVAACFRKVEEIKLCVKAAQKVGEPVEVEPEFSQAPENTL